MVISQIRHNPKSCPTVSIPDVSPVIAVAHAALISVLVDAEDSVGVGRPRRGQAKPDVVLHVRPEDVALQVSVVPVR